MTGTTSITVGLFHSHQDVEIAIKALQLAGMDMRKLSIIGRDYHTEENVVGYYNIGERATTWGKYGLFWGGVWGLLFGSAFFMIPGIGPVVVGGPVVGWIVGALEAAAITGGLSALGGALVGAGLPRDSVLRYETALKASKFLLLLHGTEQQAVQAREILLQNKAEEATLHKELREQQDHSQQKGFLLSKLRNF